MYQSTGRFTSLHWGAGIFLAHKLKLSMVYNVRWTTPEEGHFEIALSPLSYIPITRSRNTQTKLTFFSEYKIVCIIC